VFGGYFVRQCRRKGGEKKGNVPAISEGERRKGESALAGKKKRYARVVKRRKNRSFPNVDREEGEKKGRSASLKRQKSTSAASTKG